MLKEGTTRMNCSHLCLSYVSRAVVCPVVSSVCVLYFSLTELRLKTLQYLFGCLCRGLCSGEQCLGISVVAVTQKKVMCCSLPATFFWKK